MLQTLMQTNAVLYGMGILCILGAVSQLILGMIYHRMRKDVENEHTAKGKFIKQVRQRYDLRRRMGGAVNTQNFIEKSLQQYRRLGLNLHQWRRIGGILLALSLGLGLFGYYTAIHERLYLASSTNYLWAMGLSVLFMAAVYGLTDTRYRQSCLVVGLTDMLEGSGQGSTSIAERAAAKEGREEISAKSRSFREGKAKKEKQELKESLSRVKEAVGESAASRERERNAEILKNMDPAEQERVIREVLKEFLS